MSTICIFSLTVLLLRYTRVSPAHPFASGVKREMKRTMTCSAWFGHIHFLPAFGMLGIGGFKQSRCQDKEQ